MLYFQFKCSSYHVKFVALDFTFVNDHLSILLFLALNHRLAVTVVSALSNWCKHIIQSSEQNKTNLKLAALRFLTETRNFFSNINN